MPRAIVRLEGLGKLKEIWFGLVGVQVRDNVLFTYSVSPSHEAKCLLHPDQPVSEELCLLGCYAVRLLLEPTFRRNLAPPTSE
jgi:hypothetical protein